MTRTHTSFPIAFRAAVIGCILLLAGVVVGAADAAPTKDEVEAAEARVDDLLAQVERARAELAEIDARLAKAGAEVEAANGRLEALTAELLLTRERLDRSRARYDNITERLNERAVQAFMGGPASELEFLLGSSSMGELSDRLEYIDAVAQSDADLAVEVEDLRTQLETDERLLESLQSQARSEQEAAEARKADVIHDLERQKALLASIDADLSEAESTAKKLSKAYKAALAAAASQGYGGGHDSVPMPPGWEDVLEVCPVGAPRSYWDGFGAPRYAGGYHLHKGNDILAPAGTPIYAPFDGVAHSDSNTLGGLVVFVEGRFGRVYNAHLSALSGNSNGPVVAGEIIGYVGDSGDATGIPHDHFEFHPWVMPSSWPASSYGYSIIEDAINPYPLLVAACG